MSANFSTVWITALVMHAVRRITSCKWALLYIERWLQADVQLPDGTLQQRPTGTPHGSVISPLLANIFLHLAFDQWMKTEMSKVHFERYADDIVVHCRSRHQLEWVRARIESVWHSANSVSIRRRRRSCTAKTRTESKARIVRVSTS